MAYRNVGPESKNQESLESKPLLYYRNFKYLVIGIYVIGPGDGNKLPVRVKRMGLVSCIDSVSSPLSLSPDSRLQRAPPQFSLQYVCSTPIASLLLLFISFYTHSSKLQVL